MLECNSSGAGRALSILAFALVLSASPVAALEESVTKLCAPAWKAIDPDGDTFADPTLTEAGLAAARQCEAEGHPLGTVSVANILGRLRRDDEAAEVVRRAIASGTELAAAYRERCLIESRKGAASLAAALAACDEATRLEPNWFGPYLARGFIYYSSQRYTDAEREWRAALARESRFAPLHQNLGLALGLQNRHAEALQQHLAAQRLAPNFSETTINVALSLESLGRQDEALEQYERLLAREPRNVQALRGRGRLFEAAGQFSTAREDYARIRAIDPRSMEAAMDELRTSYLGGGASPEALEAKHQQVVRLANELGTPEAARQYRRGYARIARERLDWVTLEALSTNYIKNYPQDVFGYAERSLARRMRENWAGVVEDETRVLELEPNRKESLYWRGEARVNLADGPGADADLSRLLQLEPKNGQALLMRGHLRVALDRPREGYQDLLQVLSLQAGRVEILWHYLVLAGLRADVPKGELRALLDSRAPQGDEDVSVWSAYEILKNESASSLADDRWRYLLQEVSTMIEQEALGDPEDW